LASQILLYPNQGSLKWGRDPPSFTCPPCRPHDAGGHGQGKIVSEEELRAIVEQYDLDGSGTFEEVRFIPPACDMVLCRYHNTVVQVGSSAPAW
jgi:hypothetical protein